MMTPREAAFALGLPSAALVCAGCPEKPQPPPGLTIEDPAKTSNPKIAKLEREIANILNIHRIFPEFRAADIGTHEKYKAARDKLLRIDPSAANRYPENPSGLIREKQQENSHYRNRIDRAFKDEVEMSEARWRILHEYSGN